MYRLSLLIFSLLGYATPFCQGYTEWMTEGHYVPQLIQKGINWQNIADSISFHYPQKEIELQEVSGTIGHLKIKCADPIICMLNQSFEFPFDKERFIDEVARLGKKAIPALIKQLEKDFATRWVVPGYDWDEPAIYLCLSDVALRSIEEISGINFFSPFAVPGNRFSDAPAEVRKAVSGSIVAWYNETGLFNKAEGINYFLETYKDYPYGNTLTTLKNLVDSGDTANAIIHLEYIYHSTAIPCRKNLSVAEMMIKLGQDVAMEDCLHDIYDYRCMGDYSIACVSYIFKYAQSHIPFEVLADIVSTERYSRYKKQGSQFIWHHIFNHLASNHHHYAKPILVALLPIQETVKGSNIVSGAWKKWYPKEYDNHFRVCDFSLLKLSEIFPDLRINVDWNDRVSMDREIKRILGDGGDR